MKKVLSVILTLCMLVATVSMLTFVTAADEVAVWDGTVGTSFAGGTGTEIDPYLIANGAQLAYMAKVVNETPTAFADKAYKLTADIALNDVSNYDTWEESAPANNWTPISTYDNPFLGTFDGNGKTITGLYCKVAGDAGLFDSIGGEAIIKNFAILKSMIIADSTDEGAAVAANIKASTISKNKFVTFQGIYVQANVIGTKNVAGLVGICQESSGANKGAKFVVDSCVFEGTVVAEGDCIGGILGNANNFSIEISNCLNLGEISGNKYMAGIVGRQDNTTNEAGIVPSTVVSNCVNLGTFDGGNIREILSSYYDQGTEKRPFAVINDCYGSQPDYKITRHSSIDDVDCREVEKGAVEKTYNDLLIEDLCGLDANYPCESFTAEKWAKRESDVMLPASVAAFAPAYLATGETFTITWVVEGETVETDVVTKGELPTFDGATPTKAADENYAYTFNGWDAEPKAAFENATYTAEFVRTRIASDDEEETESETQTETNGEEQTTTEAVEENGGCGAAVGGGMIMLAATIGCGVVLGKKKKED